MYFLLTLCFSIVFLPHDIDIANFSFIQNENSLLLKINLDKEDTEYLFHQNLPEQSLSDNNLTTFMENYLNKNMTIVVDGKKVNFTPISLDRNSQFYYFKFQATASDSLVIHNIQLENTCFIHEFEGYNNLMNFDMNEDYRTFRMHKGRWKISFDYGR